MWRQIVKKTLLNYEAGWSDNLGLCLLGKYQFSGVKCMGFRINIDLLYNLFGTGMQCG